MPQLKKEVQESATVKIIGLPQPNQNIPEDTQMILTGFGAAYTGGPVSPKLRQLYMYATNPQDCATYWSSRGVITVAHLCADLDRGYGACQVSITNMTRYMSERMLFEANKITDTFRVTAVVLWFWPTSRPSSALFPKVSAWVAILATQIFTPEYRTTWTTSTPNCR